MTDLLRTFIGMAMAIFSALCAGLAVAHIKGIRHD